MSKKEDELNDFVDEVTDGVYNLPCVRGNGTVVIPTKREKGSVGEGETDKKTKVTQHEGG
jgi:hypothetical protein